MTLIQLEDESFYTLWFGIIIPYMSYCIILFTSHLWSLVSYRLLKYNF